MEWRGQCHEHPELNNQEIETAKNIAAHLISLSMEVQRCCKTTVSGVYFFLYVVTLGPIEMFPHQSPDFVIDESGMLLGVKTMAQLAIDCLNQN